MYKQRVALAVELSIHTRCLVVCTHHSLFDKHARRSKICTEQSFLICMRDASKYARSNRFDNYMLGTAKYERATVFDMHAWQSKYAQSNRFYMRARLNELCTVQPFSICHARSCEVCTEHACSSHRSMHGATVLYACSVQRSMHGATVFDMHARWSEVCTEHPVLTFVLGAAKYAQSNRF